MTSLSLWSFCQSVVANVTNIDIFLGQIKWCKIFVWYFGRIMYGLGFWNLRLNPMPWLLCKYTWTVVTHTINKGTWHICQWNHPCKIEWWWQYGLTGSLRHIAMDEILYYWHTFISRNYSLEMSWGVHVVFKVSQKYWRKYSKIFINTSLNSN